MIVDRPHGTQWRIDRAPEKLRLRAGLPGARVFDLAADSLRKAKAAGLTTADRLALALPASWCVNSPAPSTVLRRWALPPQRDVWEGLVDVLDDPRDGALDPESAAAVELGVRALGGEAFVVEAASKVLALLVPDAVPLMPPPAVAFVLGEGATSDARTFVAMVDWFATAVGAGRDALASWAAEHDAVPLGAAQVLDRLLWFDSDGARHWPRPARK